jgi:hypothetical protein
MRPRLTRLVPALVLATVLWPTAAVAQQFEGTIITRSIYGNAYAIADATGTNPSEVLDVPIEQVIAARAEYPEDITVQEATMYVKGSLVRMEMPEEEMAGGYAIMDMASGLFRMVQPAERVYVEWTVEEMQQMRAMAGATPYGEGEAPAPAATPRPLGITKVVNGVECAAYEFMAEQASMWDEEGEEELNADKLFSEHGFPMLMQTLSWEEDYEVEEVLAVEPGSVDDAMFQPPSGYRKMTIQDMMGGMMQQMERDR